MNHNPSPYLASRQSGSSTGLAYYNVPTDKLSGRQPLSGASNRRLRDLLAAPGWYSVTSRTGLQAQVAKVGQADNVLNRLGRQKPLLAENSHVHIAVAAPDSHLAKELREAVEWTVGCTLARAAAHGLLTTTYREQFTKPDKRVNSGHVDALAVDVLRCFSQELGCAAWQILALRQRLGPLWEAHVCRGRSGDTLQALRRLFDAGLIAPGDRLAFLAGPVSVTVTENLLCRIGSDTTERTLRKTADVALSRGGYSPNTRRNAWDAFTVISNDHRAGRSLSELRDMAGERLDALVARCHLPR